MGKMSELAAEMDKFSIYPICTQEATLVHIIVEYDDVKATYINLEAFTSKEKAIAKLNQMRETTIVENPRYDYFIDTINLES